MMAFPPSNSNYTSPRCKLRPRQTHIYYNPTSNQPHLNGAEETLTRTPRLQSSSLRLLRGTSLNLLSRISKFEALDALSLPIKFPFLRPAHLQMSRNLSSRKRTEASQSKRLSTIFSPRIENRDQNFFSEDDSTSGRDSIGSTKSKAWMPSSKESNLRKRQKSQISHRSSNIRGNESTWKTADASPRAGIGDLPASYRQKEDPTKRKTIKEMIKFYDGSTDIFVSKVATKRENTHARPSALSTTQVSPILSHNTSDCNSYSNTLTASSRHNLATRQTSAPISPTKSYRSFAASQRQPFIGSSIPNSTIHSGPLPSESSTSKVSPGTITHSKKSAYRGYVKSPKPPISASPDRGSADSNRPEAPSSGRKRNMPVSEIRGWTLVRTAGSENPARTNLGHRKICNKIEETYRTISLDRNYDTPREVAPPSDLATARSRKVTPRDSLRRAELQRELGGTHSKVTDMRIKFEDTPKVPLPAVPLSIPMAVFSNASPFPKDRIPISEVPTPPPLPPVFMPSSDSKRKSNISPKMTQEASAVDARKDRIILNFQEVPRPITIGVRGLNKTARNIRGRIKLLESLQGTEMPGDAKRKSSYSRRIRMSMKSLFEPTSWKSDQDGGGLELNSKDMKDVIDEFQGTGTIPNVEKQSESIGEWYAFQHISPSSGKDVTMSGKGIASPSADEMKEMIVKEVECGLKQPKPVRITEMERMVLLCRERVGGIIDKERSRLGPSRKL